MSQEGGAPLRDLQDPGINMQPQDTPEVMEVVSLGSGLVPIDRRRPEKRLSRATCLES